MSATDTAWAQEVLQEIVGRQLSSVEFVQDYVQLRFDGPTLTAVTQPVVEVGGEAFRWNDRGFRDELCARITKKVVSARVLPEDSVRITFGDGAVVKVSLHKDDYRAAEAVKFDVTPATWWVL